MNLADVLIGDPDAGAQVPQLRQGVVTVVSPLTVRVGTAATARACNALASYAPVVGDVVSVLVLQGDRLVLGPTSGVSHYRKCTSATRPTSLAGDTIYETDTFRRLQYDGTGWVILSEPANGASAACFTGITGGTPTYLTVYHRSDGYIDVVSTVTFAGVPSAWPSAAWTPPIAADGLVADEVRVAFFDATGVNVYAGMSYVGTTSVNIYAAGVSGTVIRLSTLSTTVPFTWAANSRIEVKARYRMTTRYS